MPEVKGAVLIDSPITRMQSTDATFAIFENVL